MGALACGAVETFADDVLRVCNTAPALAAEIADFTGIAQVVEWMSNRGHGQPAFDLVAMDEFEYDFLVQTEPKGRWLAFGVT
jgi:hypothetical protein